MSDVNKIAENFDFHGEALDNIFDTYAALRNGCPVGRSKHYGGFWFLTKSDDIFAAEQDPQAFSVAPSMMVPSVSEGIQLPPIDIDPPEHTAYRRILLPLFTPQELKKLEQPIRDTARSLAEEFAKKGSGADASYQYSRPLPTIIFSRLAGYPESDWPKFDKWVDDIIYERVEKPEVAQQACRDVFAYFGDLLDKWEDPGENQTLMDYLCKAKLDGRPLTRDELLRYCYLLFLAGLDTTAWSIRAGLWHLANNVEDQRKLRENPELIPMACEEFLRTLSPVQVMGRTCLKDTVIRGQEIKEGDRVMLVFGAGNRDEEIFPDPDKIDIGRQENRHLAFGGGIHRCLGSNLGRRELVVGIEEFLRAVPEFRPADPSEKWHGVGPLKLAF
ncbi:MULTISPECIES: cytochrome P450 [Pseudomonas]|uniref:cytochrome P450 n=1 Tax=Pseudomonas TaxID=286 RepID=UPI000CD467E9|nr:MULTISPECIES: cytochrome P450 [Pseudomonas]PTC01751.1 cytochrome P450 [Thalassospira xiamenensis]AVD83778.1 cytochrome P450 [Pseudomonas sp. SWI6]AVD95052.1 cytochrome P450 [Pseudomonas sp. SWI36]ELU0814310.1 cytochrome P450 [Pseudomonas putida]MBH3388636.1 cytochrome P450 [Pseudomonas putida]